MDFLLEQKIATTRQQCVDIGSQVRAPCVQCSPRLIMTLPCVVLRQLLSLGLRPLEDETMPFLDNYTFYTFVRSCFIMHAAFISVLLNCSTLRCRLPLRSRTARSPRPFRRARVWN